VLPLILGVIIGPLMETKMREALDLSDGSISGLFNEGLAIFIYVIIVLALVVPTVVTRMRGRPVTPAEDTERAQDQEVDR
jgi:putative tricarboxylic transport membrane protein